MSEHPSKIPTIEELAELLPQYGIDSFIAHGGMGAVYKGRQLSLDREVAIKVLLNEFGDDAAFRESFTTEAKAMARLNHPNLLSVFDYGDINGMPYIVMEYVEGGSLHEAAWNKVIDAVQAVEIVNGICKGLANAHENGIIHRDIKPANILLTLKAEPKIADFGLAQAQDAGQSEVHMGTPGFTAPEVFDDPAQAGVLADIYSVGVIFHQLLTGLDHTGNMAPPSQASGIIRLDAIWRKATHITPSQRYASISEMSVDLEKWSDSKLVLPGFSAGAINAQVAFSTRPPVYTKADSGTGMKILVIVILLAALGFTFLLIEKDGADDTLVVVDNSAENDDNFINPNYIPNLDPLPVQKQAPQPVSPPGSSVQAPSPALTSSNSELVTRDNSVKINSTMPTMPTVPTIPTVVETEREEENILPPGDSELLERGISLITKAHDKRLAEFAKKDSSKKRAINEAYSNELEVIRAAYVSRLQKAANETPDPELKRRLQAQAGHAEDLDVWVALLVPDLKEPQAEGVDAVIGNWDQFSDGKVSRWTAHADGSIEVIGKKWDVTWTLHEDGTLQVDWGKIRPFVYTRDSEGWIGKTTFGHETTLRRGDW